MAPLSAKTLTHFLHPAHELTKLMSSTSYQCDGCKVPGTGTRFTCTLCNFDLHDCCATCPCRLTSQTNHPHPMSLVVYKPKPNQTQLCQCCHHPIEGLAYSCKDCNVWIHPLCVSYNSGEPVVQDRAVASGSGSQNITQQVAVGLGTNALFEFLKNVVFEGSSSS